MDPHGVQDKNYIRLRLFTELPEAQSRIKEIRERFGITEGRFPRLWDALDWLEENQYLYLGFMPAGFYKTIPVNPFRDAIESLGKEFGLPANFTCFFFVGVAPYVISGQYIPPSQNWELVFPLGYNNDPLAWVGIREFQPLTKEERNDAWQALQEAEERHLSKGVIYPLRGRERFEDDLKLIQLLRERKEMPRSIKQHTGYAKELAHAIKRGDPGYSKENLLKYERENPNCYSVEYDQETIASIAKETNRTPEAVRQAVKRLNDTVRELYGRSFIEGNDSRST